MKKGVIPAKAGIQSLSSLRMHMLNIRRGFSFNILGFRIGLRLSEMT